MSANVATYFSSLGMPRLNTYGTRSRRNCNVDILPVNLSGISDRMDCVEKELRLLHRDLVAHEKDLEGT